MATENEIEGTQTNYYGWHGRNGFGDDYVNRYEADLMQKLADEERKNAILRAENDTDKKLVDVYAKLETKINKVAADVEENRRHQEAINREQAVYNGVANSQISLLKDQVKELQSLAELKIPAYKVSPLPMPRYNDWEAPIATQNA